MESPQTQLDAVLGALDFDGIAGVPTESPTEPETTASPEEEAVAPSQPEDPTESAADAGESPDAAATEPSDPSPAPPPVDFDSDANPYKAEAEQARQMRQLLERAYAEHQQKEADRQRTERETQLADRLARLGDEFTPEQAKVEARRIVAEVEAELSQQAQSQISEREDMAGQAAKAFASWYTAAQKRLTPEQFKQLEADAKFTLQFDSPEAMTQHYEREAAITQPLKQQIATLSKKIEELTLAQAAKERIEEGADAAGAGVGAPATGSPLSQTDEAVARAFAAAGFN